MFEPHPKSSAKSKGGAERTCFINEHKTDIHNGFHENKHFFLYERFLSAIT